jgi:WNK lysine deficient protein kinase
VSGLPQEEKDRLLTEVEILKEMDHKNILKFHHSWTTGGTTIPGRQEKSEMSVNFITVGRCRLTLGLPMLTPGSQC